MAKRVAETQEEKEETKLYELGYLLAPDVTEEGVNAEVESLRSVLEKNGAVPFSEEMPGKRVLAYEMSKRINDKRHAFTQGYFGWMRFELGASKISFVKDALDHNDRMIRFSITRPERERFVSAKKRFGVRSMLGRTPIKKEESLAAETEPKKLMVTEADLDKTIEELIVE